MRKEKQNIKMNENPFCDWMNDFEIPRTNEWKTKKPVIQL